MSEYFNNFITKVKDQYKDVDKFSLIYVVIVLLAILISSILGFSLSATKTEAWVIVLSTISSVTGVLCVFGLANKNYMGYVWGVIQVVTYGIVAINWILWGQVFLSFFIYLPANIMGFALWQKNNEKEYKVRSRSLSKMETLMFTAIVAILSAGFILIFIYVLNDSKPILDGLITSLAIAGTFLMVNRYTEQWVIWTIVNILTVILYAIFYSETGAVEYLPQLIMWIFTLINSIYGLLIWTNAITFETIIDSSKISSSNGYKTTRRNKMKFNIKKLKK